MFYNISGLDLSGLTNYNANYKMTMTTNIREKTTGKTVPIEGDLMQAMKACVLRNRALRREGMGGKWQVEIGVPFHLSPKEYVEAVGEPSTWEQAPVQAAPRFYGKKAEIKLSDGTHSVAYTSDPYDHDWVIVGRGVYKYGSATCQPYIEINHQH